MRRSDAPEVSQPPFPDWREAATYDKLLECDAAAWAGLCVSRNTAFRDAIGTSQMLATEHRQYGVLLCIVGGTGWSGLENWGISFRPQKPG